MCREQLLSIKELARALNRSESYVYHMTRAGFKMFAGRATLKSALTWLSTHPHPVAESRKTRRKRS